MFNAKERIIGATYFMPDNIAELALQEIKCHKLRKEKLSEKEIRSHIILDKENLTENERRKRIIKEAEIMEESDAGEIWNRIEEFAKMFLNGTIVAADKIDIDNILNTSLEDEN